jgi:HSP20 family molecular chaperone IbpA
VWVQIDLPGVAADSLDITVERSVIVGRIAGRCTSARASTPSTSRPISPTAC